MIRKLETGCLYRWTREYIGLEYWMRDVLSQPVLFLGKDHETGAYRFLNGIHPTMGRRDYFVSFGNEVFKDMEKVDV